MNPYLSDRETDILVELVNAIAAVRMMEFGCNAGHTAKAILDRAPTIERYIGVDVPADHVPPLECQRSEVPRDPGFYARRDPRFELLVLPNGTRDLTAGVPPMVDAIFIDGDHSAAGVLHDSMLARAMVRPGGLIVWHDWRMPGVEVTGVLERLVDEGWPIVEVRESWLAFMHVPETERAAP